METGKGCGFGLLQRSVARACARAEREPKSLYNFIPVYIHKTKNFYRHSQSLLPCYIESQSLRSVNIIIVILFCFSEQILNFPLLECGPCVCVRACVRASPLSSMSLVSNFRTVAMFLFTELLSATHIGLYNTNQ